ncbi:peptide-methionine (S)-S-oxide reductase [Candidatus Parcubacteria bacterium]|nr:MAG: peptide-methionine (S)-S-oxide reductase [Candidatus Parcubacteria bacterium]
MKDKNLKTEKATFGAGCFWGVEDAFHQLKGVVDTKVGYMGGTLENPSYEEVCTNTTGHAEVVQVEYDPKSISYDQLLETFWKIHDPTQFNRQGADVGTQYRSVIFYHTQEQKNLAEASKSKLEESKTYRKQIATAIEPAKTFYKAEEYHQRYFEKQGISTCRI